MSNTSIYIYIYMFDIVGRNAQVLGPRQGEDKIIAVSFVQSATLSARITIDKHSIKRHNQQKTMDFCL